MAELPSGTVTFLFTDLEGSTRLWEQQPGAMQAALARHDELLADAVASHGGQIVKTTGDGLHAAFATADDAVAAAVAGQHAMRTESWQLLEPLRVRMGVHTGVAELRGHDYYGTVLNRAARLMSAAHPEQVLCSQTTADLVRDSLPAPFGLVELGPCRLRDLERPEVVFQLTHPDLVGDFPPLSTPDAFAGNLPVQVTSFVGREFELARVADALGRTRVVTITGVGGVGKTRLAYRAASDARASYADGVWVCELAGVRTSDAVAEAVTATFGVQPPQGVTVRDTLVAYLRNKDVLLVLDNCEHLLTATAKLVADLVRSCPGLGILATSRESLNVPGEQILGVPSMATPDEGAGLASVAASEAVQLFVERAHAVKQGFALDDTNAAAIAELCRRLDGIPLAIELAAARIAMLTPAELARRLDQRFRLLTGSERGAVERHQTLRAAIDWSYDLLSEPERQLLDRLSVFAGGFTLDAAETITAGEGIDRDDVFDFLAALVARYLVVANVEDAETRYQLLETIRQYAQEHLDETHDAERIRAAHATFFAHTLHESASHVTDTDALQREWRLDRELDNLRAALAWAIDRARAEIALRLLCAVDTWFGPPDVIKAFQAFAQPAIAIPDADREPQFPMAVAIAANFAVMRGDLALAASLCDTALTLDTGRGKPTILALLARSSVASFTNQPENALFDAQRAAEVARERGDTPHLAQALGATAVMHITLGNDADGTQAARDTVEVTRRSVFALRPRSVLLAIAGSALAEADVDDGFALVREAIEISEPLGERTPMWGIAAYLAWRLGVGQREALENVAKSIVEFHQVGAVVFTGVGLRSLAIVLGTEAPEAVAQLHGWTEAHAPDYPMYPRFQQAYEGLIAAIESALGTERARQLETQGAAMDVDHAVEFALNTIDRALANPDTPSTADTGRSAPGHTC